MHQAQNKCKTGKHITVQQVKVQMVCTKSLRNIVENIVDKMLKEIYIINNVD